MSLLFRPLVPADLSAMSQVEQAAHPHPWSVNLLADSFSERNLSGGAWSQQQLLGYFIADTILDESTLLNICVQPYHQGAGVGSQLLRYYLEQCAHRAIKYHYLEVRASNQAALTLYARYGYIVAGRRRDYYPTQYGHEDAILMQLTK